MSDKYKGFFESPNKEPEKDNKNNPDKTSNNPNPPNQKTGGFNFDISEDEEETKKKRISKKGIVIFIIIMVVLVGGVLGIKAYMKASSPEAPDTSGTKSAAYSRYFNNLIDKQLSEDMYLNKDIQFFNENQERIAFYDNVILKNIQINIPEKKYSAKMGGKTVTYSDDMNSSTGVDFTYIDYKELAKTLNSYYHDDIVKQFKESGIKTTDYDFKNEMIDFFCSYMVRLEASAREGTPDVDPSPEIKKKIEEKEKNKTSAPVQETEEQAKQREEKEARQLLSQDYLKKKKLATNKNNPLIVNKSLPLTTSTIEMPTEKTSSGYSVTSDAALDDVLFQSDDFKILLDEFAKISLQYNTYSNTKDWNVWIEQVGKANSDMTSMLKNKDTLVAENQKRNEKLQNTASTDMSSSSLGSSTSEEDKKDAENESEKRIVEVADFGKYRVEARELYVETIQKGLEDGLETEPVKQSINPLMSEDQKKKFDKLVKAKKDLGELRKYSIPYVSQSAIPYDWVGANVLLNAKDAQGNTLYSRPPLGNGSMESPASFDTPIITEAIDRQNKYNPVRVTLKQMLTGQEAIDYIVNKDDRNKGFQATSKLELAVFIFNVENLENKKIKIFSGLTLADPNRTNISRTGFVYNLNEEIEIGARQTGEIEDWVYTTEINNRYAMWGKTFGRTMNPVWYRVLKAEKSGKIEAYAQNSSTTTSESTLDSSSN